MELVRRSTQGGDIKPTHWKLIVKFHSQVDGHWKCELTSNLSCQTKVLGDETEQSTIFFHMSETEKKRKKHALV